MDDKQKEYKKLKEQLKQALQQRRQQEQEWDRLQQEIFDKETEYLSGNSSSQLGNIVSGFDGFAKHHGNHHDNNGSFSDHDRIFSLSSALFVKQQRGLQDEEWCVSTTALSLGLPIYLADGHDK